MTTVAGSDTRGVRVAPHSIEAEESVLGAIMISAEATDVALERLQAEDFYKPAHQAVFAAVAELFDGNEPVDVVTVTEALRRSGALERVGGIGFVTALSDAVPTASNIDHYAAIVEEHALRRRLLKAGGEIGNLATSVDRHITDVLDTAEQTVFGVSDRRIGDGLALIDPLLFPAIEKAEGSASGGARSPGFPPASVTWTGCSPGSIPPTCSSLRRAPEWERRRWHCRSPRTSPWPASPSPSSRWR